MRILVIDDDEQVRILLKRIMEWAGYEVVEAENGRQGVRCQRSQSVDLVITDLIMPEQEGLETIRELRKDFPDLKIIAISGGGRIDPETYLAAAGELGANRIFSKPFDIQVMLNTVRELLADA